MVCSMSSDWGAVTGPWGGRRQVHYDIPASADLYVHRSGRTARAAQGGVAVALVTPEQSRTWDRLLAALGHPPASVPPFPVVGPLSLPSAVPPPRGPTSPSRCWRQHPALFPVSLHSS